MIVDDRRAIDDCPRRATNGRCVHGLIRWRQSVDRYHVKPCLGLPAHAKLGYPLILETIEEIKFHSVEQNVGQNVGQTGDVLIIKGGVSSRGSLPLASGAVVARGAGA